VTTTVEAPEVRTGRAAGGRWRRPAVLPVYTWLMIVYLSLPILVMIVFGFNNTHGRLNLRWQGFTLLWYRNLFAIGELTTALRNSLTIALLSTVISTVLGTMVGLALGRHRFRGQGLWDGVILADLAAPSVVVGASLLGFFITLGLPRGFLTILIAHIAFNVAFVIVILRARVSTMDSSLEDAARDLGASAWVAFSRVTLPLIVPGIIAAALMGFALSIDDYIITSFVAGQTLTFPLWVYGAVKVGIPPQVFVMGTLIFVGGVLLAIASVLAQRRGRPAPA
jgi:spermidine/putrescine transport system permease protein